MAKKNKNSKNHIGQDGNGFLKDNFDKKELAQKHKEYLGMDVPDNYFSISNNNILKSLPMEKEQKRTVFGLKPMIAYPIAASIVLLIGFTIWLQNDPTTIEQQNANVEQINSMDVYSDDFLVSSLLVEDADMDEFIDEIILNEIIVDAELSEQQLENIFINSLLIEDSLINSYIDKSLIENVVL
ncbi:hypothetical protein HZY62_07260 [Maribacter polysiphoniae]|uniref:Uncharacterized protein n=1 Tax=Maribacter polysiphoniae TaxID=429344 RepID=A0A316EAQ3_9FLAO|nr:hypothetical protein [Maribacter polysiphoniae]MBD1260380.1 hypothetical protein [Maribacter polysiphoniae]PWK25843.1 hypothetical protein LX92_00587 [Maribacter polysiphoniae]